MREIGRFLDDIRWVYLQHTSGDCRVDIRAQYVMGFK